MRTFSTDIEVSETDSRAALLTAATVMAGISVHARRHR
ncbi:hypothetical protein I552_4075 [Mycobacterium xenopi 3993]|nr:hypothetical protein I552_4075 [Mycobacterium xenopi 3993]